MRKPNYIKIQLGCLSFLPRRWVLKIGYLYLLKSLRKGLAQS